MNIFILAALVLKATLLSIGRNWSAVLRAAFLPLLVPVALLLGWAYWAYTSGYGQRFLPRHVGGNAELPIIAVAMGMIIVIGTLAVAVTWHRFDLRGEVPRALDPRPGLSWTLAYLGRTLLLGFMTGLLAAVMMVPILPIADQGTDGFDFALGELPEPMTLRNFILSTVLWTFLSALMLRWSLILPAGAVGRNMSLREARQAANARLPFPVFLTLGLVLHLAPIGLNRLVEEMSLGPIGALVLLPFILLFWFMVGIAVLTTLYAHCVEDRPLRAETPA